MSINYIDAESFNLSVKQIGDALERMMIVHDAIPFDKYESPLIGADGKWWHGGGE